jgi:hypothetical protein
MIIPEFSSWVSQSDLGILMENVVIFILISVNLFQSRMIEYPNISNISNPMFFKQKRNVGAYPF